MGEPSDRIFDEMTPIVPLTERGARIAIDQLVLTAPGIQSVVLCNSMIYGEFSGLSGAERPDSRTGASR